MKKIIKKSIVSAIGILTALCCMLSSVVSVSAEKHNPATDYMSGKYGIFLHYLSSMQAGGGASIEKWNEVVNSFDVNAFADSVAEAGVSWVSLTLSQSDAVFCIPMPELEALIGGTKTSSDRDLVLDLYNALEPKGIKLMLYWIGGAPTINSVAKAMGAERRVGSNLAGGQSSGDWMLNWTVVKNMSNIMRALSERYGDKIYGWWLDGCYDSIDFNDRVAEQFGAALKSGNKNALVAFNNGTKYRDCRFPAEDYSAGESCHPNTVDKDPFTNYSADSRWTEKGYQKHFLTFLGSNWGGSGTTYNTDELVKHCYENILSKGAAISFDLNVSGDGVLAQDQLQQLKALKNYLASKPPIELQAAPVKSDSETESKDKDTVQDDENDEKKDTVTETKPANNNTVYIVVIVLESVILAAITIYVIYTLKKKKQSLKQRTDNHE